MTEATTIEYAVPAIANVFPAKLVNPDGGTQADRSRVIITPDLLVVYSERIVEGRRQIYTAMKLNIQESRPSPSHHGGWIVTDDEGRDWEITRGAWCGCGSALRHIPSPPPVDIG